VGAATRAKARIAERHGQWPWPFPAGEMTAAQVQVAAAALANEKRRPAGSIEYQPGKPMRPGTLPARKQVRVPRATMEELSKKVTP